MAARKSFLGPPPNHPELDRLLEQAQKVNVTDEQLKEQRVSFAFGNAPESSRITKESVRAASRGIRITGR
jgi:hypothetical protein